ncbi:MAG: hypothetical protein IKJ77_06620 [Firmicutes bacterium]|nr:hypothetical protein [Bacillota bacterium]
MKKMKKKTIVLFVLTLVVLYTIIYIVPKVSGAMVPSYIAEYGQLKIYDETTAYFVRNEKVYLAADTGGTNYFFKEGSLVRKDGRIMEVKANGQTGKTDSNGNPIGPDKKYQRILGNLGKKAVVREDYRVRDVGVVSYYADGYEKALTPKNMKKKGEAFFKKLSQKDVLELRRKSVIAGEPVFKIVDRTEWFLVCFVDAEHLDRYEVGKRIKVEFEDGELDARVYRASEVGGKAKITLRTDYYYEKFAETRVADVSLVTYDESGVIVENGSIAEEKGRQGVYVKGKNDEFFFVPIQIYATDGEKSLIADDFYYDLERDGEMVITVEVYDEILKNAESK